MTTLRGSYGTAEPVPVPPSSPEVPHATLSTWLITAPRYHLAWSQYNLGVLHLRETPELGKPNRLDFPGATHEILVAALDPDHGPFTLAMMKEFARTGTGMHYLRPVNIEWQFEATDEEAVELCRMACLGIIHGQLNPETGDSSEKIRAAWSHSLGETLEHMRNPDAHAAAYGALPPDHVTM